MHVKTFIFDFFRETFILDLIMCGKLTAWFIVNLYQFVTDNNVHTTKQGIFPIFQAIALVFKETWLNISY